MQDLRPKFDAEEQEFASALATRKGACPPLDVLAAVGQGVLPEDVEQAAAGHLASCKLCSGLIADLATLPEVGMTALEQKRVASRLPSVETKRSGASMQVWGSIAAVMVLGVGGLLAVRSHRSGPTETAKHSPANPVISQANVAELSIPLTPLAPPQDAAMATRGGHGGAEPSAAEMLPAFTAYNHADYAGASKGFATLAEAYPKSGVVRLYLGVSELYLGKDREAQDTLRLAEAAARSGDAKNAALWYGAIAASHLNPGEARIVVQQLCNGHDAVYAAQSCALLKGAD